MSDQNHVDTLKNLRETLVDDRRAAAKVPDAGRVRQIQEQIEVIDRAIADERKLGYRVSSTPLSIL